MESEDGISSVAFPHPDSELMAVGSSDDLGLQEPEQPLNAVAPSSSSNEPFLLADDLKDKIIRQMEFYFSEENLSRDTFLVHLVKKDKEGFVPVTHVAGLKKMKKLVRDNSLTLAAILVALQESTQLVLSSDGTKVKSVHPLLITKLQDAKLRTVLVENLPENHSTASIKRIFGDAGNVKNITIHDPDAAEESKKKISGAENLIRGKVYALVEYETVEAAEKAVATLNDEENWRTGMRVKLLRKRMGKPGVTEKGWKTTVSDKNNNASASDAAGDEKPLKSTDHHDETPGQEERHLPSERTGWRCQNRGRSKCHKQNNHNSQGHGTLHRGLAVEGSKPPPGPRMPDGTRGFTMGRGRPPVSYPNSV